MKYLYISLLALVLSSCVDDSDCQTCTSDTAGGTVTIQFCQDGPDVIQTTGDVVSVLQDANVATIVAGQEALEGVVCN